MYQESETHHSPGYSRAIDFVDYHVRKGDAHQNSYTGNNTDDI